MKRRSNKKNGKTEKFSENPLAPIFYEGKHLEGLTPDEIEIVKRISKIAVKDTVNKKPNSD